MSNHFTGLSLGPPLGDQRLDLCDLYAFQSPADKNRTVIILNANPNADALHPDAIYRVNIDNDGDYLSDMTFSYSDVEIGVIRGLVPETTKLARMPWVVECRQRELSYSSTADILFLGGFNHPPNVHAAKFFARSVMPLLRERLPDVFFNIIGSGARV